MQRFLRYGLLVVMLVSLVGCGSDGGGKPGGLPDTTIPAPPNSSHYQPGQDQLHDAAVDSFRQRAPNAFAGTTTNIYISTASMEDIKDFYTTEMPKRGWKPIKPMEFPNTVSAYFEVDAFVAAINAVDLSMTGGTGILVVTSSAYMH